MAVAGFFSKLFGGKKSVQKTVETLIEETLKGICEQGYFDLSFDIHFEEGSGDEESQLHIEFSGADEDLMKDKRGLLLDSFQLFIKRVVQHHFSEMRINVTVDCGGFREESNASLLERAENLKTIAIEQQKAVYYRALPPKERKIVHQYLSQDERVMSRSIGDGLYKKIKIFPAKNKSFSSDRNSDTQE